MPRQAHMCFQCRPILHLLGREWLESSSFLLLNPPQVCAPSNSALDEIVLRIARTGLMDKDGRMSVSSMLLLDSTRPQHQITLSLLPGDLLQSNLTLSHALSRDLCLVPVLALVFLIVTDCALGSGATGLGQPSTPPEARACFLLWLYFSACSDVFITCRLHNGRYAPSVVRVGVNAHHSVRDVTLEALIDARLGGDGVS
jgi:hypothetical protein